MLIDRRSFETPVDGIDETTFLGSSQKSNVQKRTVVLCVVLYIIVFIVFCFLYYIKKVYGYE